MHKKIMFYEFFFTESPLEETPETSLAVLFSGDLANFRSETCICFHVVDWKVAHSPLRQCLSLRIHRASLNSDWFLSISSGSYRQSSASGCIVP
jgi:hypothetical protein